MWSNYITTGYRALTKDRTYAFINIFGLALGLAACLIIFLYVRYERSYDAWLSNADRVYQVQSFGADPDTGASLDQQGVTRPVAEALAKDFPQIEAISKLESEDLIILRDGKALLTQNAKAADPSFFSIVELPFLQGDPRQALSRADGLALSRSEAMRLFGTTDALGKVVTTLRGGQLYDLKVTGVFADLPRNTHMAFNAVRRFNSGTEEECSWGCVTGNIYLKLKPGISAADINDRMPAWEKRNVPERDIAGGAIGRIYDWRIVNVRDVHLGPAQDGDRPGNDPATITTFTIIAALILAIACVNFVNLATARASQRAREVAVRKVLGARRAQLIAQFLGESILLVCLAMLGALALVEVTLPVMSRFLEAELRLAYVGPESMVGPIAALTVLVGIAGGIYPSLYLSRYKPAAILRSNRSASETAGTGRLRAWLVVGQFAVSIALIVCTIVIYQQTLFARTSEIGYERKGLIQLSGLNTPEAAAARETLEHQIGSIDGVTGVAGTTIVPGSDRTLYTTAQLPGASERVKLGWYSVAPQFFDTLKLKLLAGRLLSDRFARDSDSLPGGPQSTIEAAIQSYRAHGFNVVVNRTAAARLGFRTPEQAVGRQVAIAAFGEDSGAMPATIVGVVEDGRFRSARQPIEPMIYHDSKSYLWMLVRYENKEPEAVRAQIEQVWRRVLPQLPFRSEFAEDRLADLYGTDVARGQTYGSFALLAVAIACLGLFGLAAFTADRRTKEIGIRKVFGATVSDIIRLLVWQFSKPVVIANLIAWPAAWWLMRNWLNGFDSRITLGPGPFVLAGALAFAIAVGTIAGHAARVARSNPIHALRYE